MSAKIFNSISAKKPKRNAFDLSHEVKFSGNMGNLIPIMCKEVVPGDSFRNTTEVMLRFAPMLAPIMHHVNVYTHFFFVPNRLVWENWETFITGGPDGNAQPVFPKFTYGALPDSLIVRSQLLDYMGIPPNTRSPNLEISALPFRAYQLIFNEYYRDQNLSDPIDFSKGDGLQDIFELEKICSLRKRAWEKDYFTSALPWAQRGGDVTIPIGDSAPIEFDYRSGSAPYFVDAAGNMISNGSAEFREGGRLASEGSSSNAYYDPNGTLSVDLSQATATSINSLRRANRLQEWLEKTARGGYRYVEQILSHFGVRSSDARLQRPEFLGGGKSPVVISEVLQTSGSDTESPQGNMAGHGISVGSTHQFSSFFEEHGYVIGIMSILPRTAYQQGVARHFSKFDKFDYYFPEFAHLGEQAILNKELYAESTNPDATFGYTPRYSEYKYCPSTVHGDFRENLSFWHLGRIFLAEPALNEQFVTADPSTRIFAVPEPDQDHLWVQVYNNLQALRPMPMYGTPYL